MSALKDYKKQIGAGAVAAIFGIAILAAVSSYYFPSSSTATSTNDCPIADSYDTIPRAVWTDAPLPGYTYILIYNTTSGAVVSGSVNYSCELGGVMPSGPIQTVSDENSCAIDPVSSNPNCSEVVAPEAYLNATSDPLLPAVTVNGFSNAVYVNLQSKQLAIVPGVIFSSNYQQAYYNGQPITNGTSLPIPIQ
jgi:hypothetical protein